MPKGAAAVFMVTVAIACVGNDEPPKVTLTRPAADAPFDGTFSWTKVPSATSYNVVVYSPAGARAFEVRDLTGTGVKLSAGVKLPAGRYTVQVTAMRDGQVMVESPRTEFDVK